jgi:hypothetical protein
MKEKSHRAAQRCYRSGVEAFLCTPVRRLDGYRLYSPSHVWIRAQSEAGRCPLRHAARQLGRRGGAAEEPEYAAGADQARGRVPDRRAPAGQGPARDARAAPAARVWHRLWLRRLQRRGPGGRRRDPQTACGSRSHRRPRPGVAADPVAVRERCELVGVARPGARAGRHGDRHPPPPAEGGAPRGLPSTSTRPTTRRTASRSSASSTATTTRGATCRWWPR